MRSGMDVSGVKRRFSPDANAVSIGASSVSSAAALLVPSLTIFVTTGVAPLENSMRMTALFSVRGCSRIT